MDFSSLLQGWESVLRGMRDFKQNIMDIESCYHLSPNTNKFYIAFFMAHNQFPKGVLKKWVDKSIPNISSSSKWYWRVATSAAALRRELQETGNNVLQNFHRSPLSSVWKNAKDATGIVNVFFIFMKHLS